MPQKGKKHYRQKGGEKAPRRKGRFEEPTPGTHGVLATCDVRQQRFCGMDARILLTEHYEKIYGPFGTKESTEIEGDDEDATIDALISKEIAELTDTRQGTANTKRLWNFTSTGCKVCKRHS